MARPQEHHITPIELATIIAALRHWQQDLADGELEESPLSESAIDELCETLNTVTCIL